MSLFEHINEAPPDPILGTTIAFRADTHPQKVNVGVGAYRTNDGKPYVFPIIKKIENEIINENLDKEYQPIDGIADLKKPTQILQFGENCKSVINNSIASTQVLSGTGALRIAAEFIKIHMPKSYDIYLSKPTWGNHRALMIQTGLNVKEYTYWDNEARCLNIKGMLESLKAAAEGSVIVLHSCAHNPTGMDPSKDEWKEIAKVMQEKKLIPMFDNAYQGYASGDLENDAFAIRYFEQMGFEMFVCQSFAKNMGLYGERMGMLHIVCKTSDQAKRVLSQLKLCIRPMYSSPPLSGARLVVRLLTNPAYFEEWKKQLKEVSDRILLVRQELRKGLEAAGTPGKWDHITKQIGMFSFTGLNPTQCERMISTWHVYMLKNGRISLAGLNTSNVAYMVRAMDDCVKNAKL